MSPLIAYHYNTTYTGYTSLENDHCRKLRTAEPYIYALEHDDSVFSAMLLLGMYKGDVQGSAGPYGEQKRLV